MTYTFISITDFLSNTQSPSKEELELFSKHRDRFLRTNKNESEEHQKIALIDFLSQSFAYVCNTNKRIDLSIYEDSKAKVLFEVKSLSNKSEFIKGNNLESKAFYESILYFLREYKTHNNNNLKYIILTNTRDFYLIDAREYLQFAKDKTILNAFDNCEKGQGVDTSTEKFYATLKDYLPTLNSTLKFTYFNIQDTPLALLYQALSPQVLLKRKTYIDANTLNQSFYDELLYILGLKEISQNGKVLIQASDTQNTLLDSIANAFQLSPQDDFETIFSLLTTWNNRILFLRLLESMLLSFKHIDKPFLDIDILKDFTDLNTLFFKILAIRENKRQSTLKELDSIPYLNSSLFDKTELEREGKEIKFLDSKTIAIFKHSILKKDKDYKDTKSLPLLEYLFRFLHAYDFTTTPKDIQDNVKINHDKLINAAVLGLVFEKLNGYKEGSFYTPSFITSYMCKESLEKVIIDKFNTAKSWECDSLESLEQKLDKLTDSKDGYKEANTIFDSIKVCDPAVGSGHFLASMLNNMIELKYRLKILCEIHFDDKGERQYKRLKDIDLKLENDEILIKDSNNILHMYQTPARENIESHRIQKAIFHNKRTLIESCLFGVDINPNSCEITKLRLWIELLKYGYYIFENGKNTNTLQTLPNIDINIKCGNSLISRFDLKDSLKHIPNINHQIAKYQKLVSSYKNADQSTLNISKQEIEAQIEKIKQTFTLTLKDPKTKQELEKAIETHITNYGISLLDNTSLLDGLSYTLNMFGNPQLSKEQENKAYISYGKIMALRKKLDSFTSGESYTNAFEWRFEFPEVLDSNGDFLGFDLIIGNPPYIKENDNKEVFTNTKNLRTYQGKMDIWYHFVGRGFDTLKENGFLSFIATNNWTTNSGAKKLRNIILQESQILSLIDFTSFKVFDSASIQTMIMQFQKTKPPKKYKFHFAKITSPKPTYEDLQDVLNNKESPNNEILEINFSPKDFIDKTLNFTKNDYEELFNKIQQYGNFYLEESEVAQGIVYPQENVNKKSLEILGKGFYIGQGIQKLTEDELNQLQLLEFEKNLLKPIYESNDIKKYFVEKNNNFWVIYTNSSFKKPNSMDNYPNLKKHLDKFKEVITSDNKPYGLHRARDEKFFTGSPRIIALRKCVDEPKFSYVDFDCYVSATFYIIKTQKIDTKYLTAVLNSKLIAFWLKHKGKMQGNNYQIDKEPLLNIPIPKIDSTNKAPSDEIISLVEQILDSKAKDPTTDTKELESKIDSLVYKLYHLTNDEIKIIENKE